MGDAVDDDDNRAIPPTSSVGSWWGAWSQGWIDTVKQKSAHTMQMVKKDLNEFVEVIQGDTSVALSETASKIKEVEESKEDKEYQKEEANFGSIQAATKVVETGVANFLQSVSEFLAPLPDDTNEEIIMGSDTPSSSQYNRRQERLHTLQIDPGTYCNEPEGLFNEWLEVFTLDENKLDMSNMLVQNPAVRAIYTQLVPAVVSHTMFWQRYYYQVFLLDAEEKKRQEIVARANSKSSEDDAELGWSDDDDNDGIEVLTSSTFSKKIDMLSTDEINTIEGNNSDNLTADDTDLITAAEKVEADIIIVDPQPEVASGKQLVEEENETTKYDDKQNLLCDQADEIDHAQCKQLEATKDISEGQLLDISSDVIDISSNVEIESDNETIQENVEVTTPGDPNGTSPHNLLNSQEPSETSSLTSWMSIDDVIKVKKIKGEQEVKYDSNGASGDTSTDSPSVIINKSDISDESDEDFDLDIEDDVNEEEIAKMVEEIKNMSQGGTGEDDDDWENWE